MMETQEKPAETKLSLSRKNTIIISPKQSKALKPDYWAFLELVLQYRKDYKLLEDCLQVIADRLGFSLYNAKKYWWVVKDIYREIKDRKGEVEYIAIQRKTLRENMANSKYFPNDFDFEE